MYMPVCTYAYVSIGSNVVRMQIGLLLRHHFFAAAVSFIVAHYRLASILIYLSMVTINELVMFIKL